MDLRISSNSSQPSPSPVNPSCACLEEFFFFTSPIWPLSCSATESQACFLQDFFPPSQHTYRLRILIASILLIHASNLACKFVSLFVLTCLSHYVTLALPLACNLLDIANHALSRFVVGIPNSYCSDMEGPVNLLSSNEDVQLLTQRSMYRPYRFRSATLGREKEAEDSVDPEEAIDLTIENNSKVSYGLGDGEWALTRVRVKGQLLQSGDFVEIEPLMIGPYKVSYLLIEIIIEDRLGNLSIRGLPLARTCNLQGKLPRKPNEVCRILQFDDNNVHPAFTHVDKGAVISKRKLTLTNTLYPRYARSENIVCRWDFQIHTVTRGRTSKRVEEVLERIQASDVPDKTYCKRDDILCSAWRGGRVLGGSWIGDSSTLPVDTIDLEDRDLIREATNRQEGQKYTLFDSFSGAGGVSRGAQMSGFKVMYAVDKEETTWATYRMNFPDTQLYKCRVDQFIDRARKDHIRVDFLHLSPPCQYFSPAKTRPSAHDDENIFALYSCNALIHKLRPRIITVEQTFGIMHSRHQEYFHGFLNDFTQYGYSVRWKIVRLCTWGCAQDRKRLIMIAAAPGEKLPPFPKATHCETRRLGLRPFATIRKVLHSIRHRDDLHDLDTVKRFCPRRAPYNPDRLAGTLTTGGADFVHYDGSRDFTLREFAALQGFPRYHRFKGTRTSVKKQIGNAFPHNTVRVLYQHLQMWLLRQDGMKPYQAKAPDAIMLDVDDLPQPVVVDDSDDPSDVYHSSSKSTSPEMIDLMEDEDNTSNQTRISPRRIHSAVVDLSWI